VNMVWHRDKCFRFHQGGPLFQTMLFRFQNPAEWIGIHFSIHDVPEQALAPMGYDRYKICAVL
jgi:hypothetical protein